MSTRERRRIFSAVLVFVFGTMIEFVAGSALAQTNNEPLTSAQHAELLSQAKIRLQTLVDQLGAVEACSLRADVEVVVYQSPPGVLEADAPAIGVPIRGVYEFDASGDAWRKRSYLDPTLYPGMDTAIAYNGEYYQYGLEGGNVLSVALGDDNRSIGMSLPNPLTALGQFLLPLTDDNDITLSRLRGACVADACSRADWKIESGQDGEIAVGEFPGFVEAGMPYSMRVLIDGAERGPIVMEAVTGDGVLLYRTTIDVWTSVTCWNGQTQDWPMYVLFEVPDPATGANAAEMEMVLSDISFPQRAASERTMFWLDWDSAEHVWLDDAEAFIK